MPKPFNGSNDTEFHRELGRALRRSLDAGSDNVAEAPFDLLLFRWLKSEGRRKRSDDHLHLELRELHADARMSTTVESHNTPSEDRRQVCGSDRVRKRLEPTLRPPNKRIIAPDICARIRAGDVNEEVKALGKEKRIDRIAINPSNGLAERYDDIVLHTEK